MNRWDVIMQLCFIQCVANYPACPTPGHMPRQHLDRKPTYYTAKKKGGEKKKRNTQENVAAHATVITCFTLLPTFNPLINAVFRICSAMLYLLISFGLADQRNRTGLLRLDIYCRFIKDMLSVYENAICAQDELPGQVTRGEALLSDGLQLAASTGKTLSYKVGTKNQPTCFSSRTICTMKWLLGGNARFAFAIILFHFSDAPL